MSVEGCSQEVCSSISDEVPLEEDRSFVKTAVQTHKTTNSVIQNLKRRLREE